MKDRIKLAEAMGWKYKSTNGWFQWTNPQGYAIGSMALGKKHIVPPINPFKDANDDYAVLEWMREKQNGDKDDCFIWTLFASGCPSYSYKVGDYARAALKVLE